MKTAALLVACLWLIGCASGAVAVQQEIPPRTAGYAALYNLMSRNSGVNKLLIFKSVPPEVEDAIDAYAQQCGNAADQIKQFAEDDKSIDLDAGWLTPIEKQARDGIESATTSALLTTSGDAFQKHLLLSQISSAEYGAHLAQAVADHETNDKRKKYLTSLADELATTHKRLMKLVKPAHASQ